MTHIDTSNIFRGAVWIRPTGAALHRIDQAVRVIRERVQGPPIKPHIALLSGVETTEEQAMLHLRHLARRLDPIVVRLGRIEWRHEYYRALFAVAEPLEELTAAHRLAAEIFEIPSSDPFEPHVSLAYGDLHEPLQSQLAIGIRGALDVEFTARAVGLANATADRAITDWRVVSELPFGLRWDWEDVRREWTNLRIAVRSRWEQLDERDLAAVGGDRAQLSQRIQSAYGISAEEAERQIAAWEDQQWDPSSADGPPPIEPGALRSKSVSKPDPRLVATGSFPEQPDSDIIRREEKPTSVHDVPTVQSMSGVGTKLHGDKLNQPADDEIRNELRESTRPG
ncbi:MAG: hypothetical protein C5B46_00250, partial [Proteobacteria bacterium]